MVLHLNFQAVSCIKSQVQQCTCEMTEGSQVGREGTILFLRVGLLIFLCKIFFSRSSSARIFFTLLHVFLIGFGGLKTFSTSLVQEAFFC